VARTTPARRVATRAMLATVLLTGVTTGIVAPAPDPTPPVARAVTLLDPGELAAGVERQVRTAVDAEAVGFTWSGATAGAVAFRVRQADGAWSGWQRVEGDPVEGPDHDAPEYRGRTSAGPVWVGEASRDVDVKVLDGPLRELRVHALDPGRARGTNVPAAGADAPLPPILGRDRWGADESWRTRSPGCDGNPEIAPKARYVVIHHTDTANDYAPEDVPAILRAIYSFHVFSNGWCDIGYNLVVDRFGRAWEGRAGGLDKAVIGAHAAGFNTGSQGVAVLGRFQDDVVPAAAYDGLKQALLWMTFHHGIDPRGPVAIVSGNSGNPAIPPGTVVVRPGLVGHRDVNSTVCPGNQAAALLPTLRDELSALQVRTPTYPLAGWAPGGGQALATVDLQGRVTPAGSQPAVPQSAMWPGWNPARSAVRFGAGGYVLDMWGGLHPFGGAAPITKLSYWPGWDIARDVVGLTTPQGTRAGYVLTGWGSLHPFGDAPPVSASGYWPGWDIARSVALNARGTGGYVLTGWGSLHPFGDAPPVAGTGYWPGWDIAKAVALRPDGRSGYVLTGLGSLHPFGSAPPVRSSLWSPNASVARDLVLTADGNGGWVLDDSGRLWPFGSAPGVPLHLTYVGTGLGRAAI